jgi:hypothetical protein
MPMMTTNACYAVRHSVATPPFPRPRQSGPHTFAGHHTAYHRHHSSPPLGCRHLFPSLLSFSVTLWVAVMPSLRYLLAISVLHLFCALVSFVLRVSLRSPSCTLISRLPFHRLRGHRSSTVVPSDLSSTHLPLERLPIIYRFPSTVCRQPIRSTAAYSLYAQPIRSTAQPLRSTAPLSLMRSTAFIAYRHAQLLPSAYRLRFNGSPPERRIVAA